jgi:hypothetical protein
MEDMRWWCARNKLVLNINKTVVLKFSRTHPLQSAKFLGSHIDSQLNWIEQANTVCSRLNSTYYAILKLKSLLTQGQLRSIYYGLAYPHMSFNTIVWGNSTHMSRILIAQKRLVCLIYNLKCRESCRPVFIAENILTFCCIFILKCGIFVYRNQSLFSKNRETRLYNTRFNNNLRSLSHRTAMYERSPSYSCTSIFNKLPTNIKTASTLQMFKKLLRSWLIGKCFYSLNEFYNA